MNKNEMAEALVKEELWKEKLKDDCENQDVFLALRDSKIDFYHKGGRLFSFDGKNFRTHIKYAAVIAKKDAENIHYLTEADLAKCKLISDFETNYHRIKENCAKHSGVEALGVSAVYHKHSYLSDGDRVVLDIETSFKSLYEKGGQDRIDVLLFDKESQELQFVEAKHFSNKEIWSTQTPDVIGQIRRYEEQVKDKKEEMLKRWGDNVRVLNNLFGRSLPAPLAIDEKVTLLIFGFDANQRDGRLNDLITDNHDEFRGIKCYPVGDIKGIELNSLWNAREL